jgi:hypothetical protein
VSKPIYIADDFQVEGITGPTQPDAVVLNSSSGGYPPPLQDNPVSPARLEQNRIVHLKRLQYPAR